MELVMETGFVFTHVHFYLISVILLGGLVALGYIVKLKERIKTMETQAAMFHRETRKWRAIRAIIRRARLKGLAEDPDHLTKIGEYINALEEDRDYDAGILSKWLLDHEGE